MYKPRLFLLLFFMIPSFFTGCGVFAPFIQAWKNAGATESDRQELLAPQVKKFGEALYWSKGEAILFLDPEASADVRKSLSIQREDMRVVETKVRAVEFQNKARTADVELMVKYYRIPYYIVTTAIEKQVWRFELGGTWRLYKRELAEEFKR
jgi:hypothetical protein